MKKSKLIIFIFFILLNNSIFYKLESKINNIIVVKVGNNIITSLDVQNEILTNLVINNIEINQENINKNKNFSVKNLINKSLKELEINKYDINEYNKQDLQNYINSIAKNLNMDSKNLKEIFVQNNIDYSKFIENYKIELLWNTLIYKIYQNQTNINIVDVNNEVEKIKGSKSEEELKKIKETILGQRKQKKLNLFSRSHLSNLENTTVVEFK
jgi:hypothetical protein